MRTRLSCTTGKLVSAYTESPSRALLVLIACFSDTGTLVPAGTTSGFATGVAVVIVAGCGGVVLWATVQMLASNTVVRTRMEYPLHCHRSGAKDLCIGFV